MSGFVAPLNNLFPKKDRESRPVRVAWLLPITCLYQSAAFFPGGGNSLLRVLRLLLGGLTVVAFTEACLMGAV